MIQSGGCWAAYSLWRAGYLKQGTCPWCGLADETLQHMWWECPKHESHRQEVKQKLSEAGLTLPDCLALHGIPPEPSAQLQGPVWRSGSEGSIDPEPTDLVGDDRIAWAIACEWLESELTATGQTCHVDELTVRQMAGWLHGDYTALPQWQIEEAIGCLPEDVSCYTDGGVDHGTRYWMGAGTWGMYVPGMSLEEVPEQLLEVGHARQHQEGVIVLGKLRGLPSHPPGSKRWGSMPV